MYHVFIFILWWPSPTFALNNETLDLLLDYFDGTDPKYLHNLLYGQMSFENFFGPNLNDKSQMESMQKWSKERHDVLKTKKPKDYLRNVTRRDTSDDMEYNTLAASATQLTRRWVWRPEHRWLEYYGWQGYNDPREPMGLEEVKRTMLENLGLQYLVHTRIKVYSALSKREPFKHDKRYKMGYMFYRLRRILYDLAKVVSTSLLQEDRRYWLDMKLTLRWYRKAMRLDTDLRDTIRNIKDLHIREKDPIWLPPTIEPPKKKIKPKGKK